MVMLFENFVICLYSIKVVVVGLVLGVCVFGVVVVGGGFFLVEC